MEAERSFLRVVPEEFGPAERFPVLFHLLRLGSLSAVPTPLAESDAYRSRHFACESFPRPISRCFPR